MGRRSCRRWGDVIVAQQVPGLLRAHPRVADEAGPGRTGTRDPIGCNPGPWGTAAVACRRIW